MFSDSRHSRVQRNFESALFWVWVALLCWSPIPLGSNRAWLWSALECAVFLLAAAWMAGFCVGAVTVSEPLRRARPLLFLLALWLAYQALYIVPLPAEWIGALSPEALRLHRIADGLSAGADWKTLTIDPYGARVSWLKSLLYVLSFFMTLAVTGTRTRARQLAYVLVFCGFVVSLLAVLAHLTGQELNWFGFSAWHILRALGPFANADHFAGWLEMLLSLGVGLLIADLRDRKAASWKEFLRLAIEWIFSRKMRLRLMLCVLVIGLVATRSRMGNAAFFASLFATGVIGIVLSRYATRGTVVLLASLIAIDMLIVGSWFGVDKLAHRLQETTVVTVSGKAEESLEQRSEAALYALDLIRDYPLFGSGPGSWYSAYPRYRGPDVALYYDEAHNDYIQFTAENGVIGVSLLGAIVLLSFLAALKAQYQRRDPLMRGLSFAAIMGMIAILIHSSVDFNLQIPANAMLFMVVMAFAWISLHLDRHHST